MSFVANPVNLTKDSHTLRSRGRTTGHHWSPSFHVLHDENLTDADALNLEADKKEWSRRTKDKLEDVEAEKLFEEHVAA